MTEVAEDGLLEWLCSPRSGEISTEWRKRRFVSWRWLNFVKPLSLEGPISSCTTVRPDASQDVYRCVNDRRLKTKGMAPSGQVTYNEVYCRT